MLLTQYDRLNRNVKNCIEHLDVPTKREARKVRTGYLILLYVLCVFNRAHIISSRPRRRISTGGRDTRSSHRITPLPNGYRAIGQAFWKVRSMNAARSLPFILFEFFFSRGVVRTAWNSDDPETSYVPRSTIDE